MVESVIYALIYIVILAVVVYLIVWVLEQIGVPLPPIPMRLLWVVFGLIAFLILWQLVLGPILGGGHLRLPR